MTTCAPCRKKDAAIASPMPWRPEHAESETRYSATSLSVTCVRKLNASRERHDTQDNHLQNVEDCAEAGNKEKECKCTLVERKRREGQGERVKNDVLMAVNRKDRPPKEHGEEMRLDKKRREAVQEKPPGREGRPRQTFGQ